ncbi:hypothetical protein Poli38472_000651 [Pythium oligandrum]|uniref:Uncharacterized protein n=1 Tax=Pythium oligandrum TaxID=41045 RepID=A0A8K1CC09_PYTOL|nr:hypothetical protein Poli38472_000651 [Pythium oligandrum]|eukprot:TMW60609.1 hypothetical protein Poli38472_000651 [Pythium oligandrum]
MGQQASSLAPVHPVTGSALPSGPSRPRVAAMPPQYTPLCDSIKAGDPTATVPAMTEEVKDALGKILEFGSALRYLPRDADAAGSRSVQNVEQQLQEILSAVDSPEELFQYISNLAALAPEHALDSRKDGDARPGNFDMRVTSYVKSLQQVYQLTKKERQHYEQRLQSARTQAASQRKVVPPPLPLPTQNCMTMGWDLVIHLLKATRADNPANYLQALQMIKNNLASLKPTAYADGMYLAPSASTSFNLLSECLSDLANLTTSMPSDVEAAAGASTIETLAEVALARGSLAMLLTVIFWLMKQAPSSTVNLGVTLAKLAMLKEQPLYGKCEASGELYCCGQNSYGELGIGDDIERHQLTSVSLCGWDDIRQVVSGNEMLAILTNGGVVLTCGLNKSGQCGHGHFDERVMLLRPVQALRSQKIKFIAASNGCEHMIALTDTGLAYSWGYNDRGQLGHENLTTKIHVPKLIESMKDKKVSFAAVSYHHSAVVTESGELYTFGMNDCGQLGLDHTQHVATPQLVKSLDGYEVSMVSCGLYHTVVCTAGGELFSCGKNDYGQLGLGHSRQVKVPTQVLLPNEIVCFVACGYYHSIVLTTTGHTYSFGRNDYGQLGIGTKVHQNVPNVVALSANTRMIRATCGCYHTVMLSEHGQVYVFGRNNKGQLGNRSSADSLLPVPLKVRPEKNTRRCIDIAAGFYTTSLIYERKRENEDSDALVLDQSCLVTLCGRVDIDRSGEVEGLSNFGSISTTGVALFDGKWFYEVEVVSSGLIQIGWIDNNFQGSSDQGEGVGDHSHSWSYDGNRQRRWNSGSTSYGEKWKAGDVIGCLLDLESREMTFYRNGINLGVAFTDLKCSVVDRQSGLMPGISLERGEIIRVNVGHRPFAYPPTNVGEFDAVLKAITYPATAVNIKCVEEHTNDAGPPPLEGSASVLIKNTVFVIGGSLSESAEGVSSEASNQVWAYHQDTGRWERWTDFPLGIRYHQAVALDSDHILVIGGENSSQSSRHMDLYKCSAVRGIDGSLPPWELVQGAIGAATSLPAPRAHHIAATIRVRLDTMVFLYGGKSAENETLGDIWYLSLDDFSWSRLPNSMSLDPGPRSGCDVTVIGECVYIFGGYDKEEKLHADLWRYNAFDRVWYLCHDENIAATPDSSVVSSENGVPASRSDFSPLAPEARANYSLCADYGNVWLCGGMGHAGRMLKGIWCYSITSQKWSNVDISSDDSISDGFCCGKLVVPYGVATALTQVSEQAPPSACPGRIMLFGGRVLKNGQSLVSSRVRAITPSDCARSFTSDVTKSIPTSGKSSVMLGTLRSKCTGSTIKANQQCQPEALDGSVCLLAHLDRLAGNDIPSDDTETIQSSRCPYRSLCVDPRDKTFAALHDLLHKLSVELLKLDVLNEQEDRSNEVVYVLYPLLVVVRLLKLNFFELSRCSLDPAEVGLLPESIKPGGVLHSIRELLFNIAEHNLTAQPSGEVAWYYRAVKQETAAAIYQGFSTLFPSLLDRMEVMNKLMKDDLSEGMPPSPTKKLLIPMLVPCFTAPRMLFQLMAEAPVIFTTREHGVVSESEGLRNDSLLSQIVSNCGAGKKLVDKVKEALDPGSGSGSGPNTKKLLAARLKRQDSVEAALEKSGSIESVDKAVRVAFAVLLKHSHTAYVTDALTSDGTPAEPVVDAWRSAIQLRRWIVREQQKRASEMGTAELYGTDGNMRDRQQVLYNVVCEPIIRRGEFLLSIAAAPSVSSSSSSSPFKLLPGISSATVYDLPQPVKTSPDATHGEENSTTQQAAYQLKLLMETKSMEIIEAEDERTQSDVFMFLQQSAKPKVEDTEVPDQTLEDSVKLVLQSHQIRGRDRLDGLMVFSRLLQYSESNPSCRLLIVPALSTAFKRVHRKPSDDPVIDASTTIGKVHYLENLEFAGVELVDSITSEFFSLLSSLLSIAQGHLRGVKEAFDGGVAVPNGWLHDAVREVMLAFEACSVPYRDHDWARVDRIKLLALLTELTNWGSWKATLQMDSIDDTHTDPSRGDESPIIPAGLNQRCPKIICPRSISIGTDLHQLTLAHHLSSLPNGESCKGAIAVFDNQFYHGRWYWEVSIISQSEHPLFVGVVSSDDDLNRGEGERHSGVYVFKESFSGDVQALGGVRCRVGSSIGVLLNCEGKRLEIFSDGKRICVVSIDIKDSFAQGLYAAIGIHDAEVHWNLTAPVPEKLWCNGFQFPSAVVSGCLVAAPFDGKCISWDAKSKGKQLRLTADGTTVIAGDSGVADEQFETVLANQGFDSDVIFVEFEVLSVGRNGRCDLSFSIVGSDYRALDSRPSQTLDVRVNWPENTVDWGVFGVLFDFGKGKVTVFPHSSEPLTGTIDVSSSQLKRPLYPALSILCNGSIIRADFHPRARLELPSSVVRPSCVSENSNVTASQDIQTGKLLQMQVLTCDGGEFSPSHAARNCLVDDSSVFSSTKGSNVNLVLRHEVDSPFCLSYISIRGPGPGYSSPLRHAIVFVLSSAPDLKRLQAYNNMTPEEFACLPFPVPNPQSDRSELLPVAYFVLDGSCAQIAKQLATPVMGRYIVVKLICPAAGSNIDVGYLGFCGTFDRENGPAYAESSVLSATCEECKTSPLYGVYYSPKDDDMIKVCAGCYDDYRGNLHESYFAHVDVDTDGRNDDGVALCLPRDVWQEKLSNQLGPLKRTKVLRGNTESMAASSANTRGASKIERSIAWYEDCELFSCGQNNYGELCLGHCNSTSKLEHVPFFSTKSVRDIAGGNEVLAVLMKDGTLYTCGLNKSGQCGNGTFEERVLVATPVRALSVVPIDMIAAANGCEHMLAVGADGSVYSWGYNDRGQLGLGSTISKSHTPRLVESLREKYVITCAAVSYHHSAVISSVGELLTFGMNDCGQLGLDHTQHQHTPQLVDSLSSHVITKVACGLYHTIAVTATGELYAFGKNDYGQLGLGHARNVKIPTLVRVMIGDSDEKIIDVSCGYYHTVAITEKGKLMTWGRNDYGQLGIGSKDHKNAPQYVPLPLSSRIRKTSCGCYHTLILLANGRVMVFGRNNKGQLGAGARTLPSADLPLPIPSNSLANDEVMCIAAGFYSSYILTGRSSQSCEPTEGNDTVTHAKDLPEHTNSEALYESLMKEIDRKQETDLAVKAGPIQIKKSQLYRKIPMLKLHTASWAMVRALLYQMLKMPVGDAHLELTKKKRKGVLNILTGFLLDNLKQLQAELNLDVEDLLQEVGVRLDSCMPLKNSCVGMLMFCASKNQLPATYEPRFQTLYPHFFRNQLLWVLLSCGSTDAEVCSVIAGNKEVLGEILRGIASSDLASATICIRLAMLVFPQHSVAAVNAAYRETLGTGSASSDIINALMLLVGSPSVSRPRLCNHELGVERSCTALCQSTECLKRLVPANDSSMVRAQEQVLEQSHIAIARAAEVLSLLRYLTLYPTWKIAVNASLTKAFARTDNLNEQLDAICHYYSSIQHSDDDSAAIVPTDESDQHQLNDITPSTLRKPESTSASPEIDESSSTDANGSDDKSADAEAAAAIRDKKALKTWQRAKDALDSLATLLAAVSVVGGHIETLREGVSVVVDDKEHKNSGQSGILLNLKKDTRGELSANILLGSWDHQATWAAQSLSGTSNIITGVPVKSLCPIESIPSVLNMFDGVDGIINTLSLLVLPAQDDGTLLAELEQPQNNSVQVIVGPYLQSFKKQLQWRSMKALGGLLKQMPRLVTDLIHGDTNLLSNIAQTIATENPVKNEATLGLMRVDDRLGGVHICDLLHHRWQSIKQRQVVLDTERVVDSCLDLFESDTREQVVNKLGQENALSWGLDAIQSPRKNMTTSPFFNGKTGPSAESRSGRGQNETSRGRSGQNEMPNGTWGVLHPLPQLNEAENGASTQPQAVDSVPFHLTTPIVRVGRAADSCDLIINDRSVSGRHFHLRRVRRDSEVSEDFYELQDFSKNGTIVNGVRVHGTSVRITPGSRISLILSRGGLVTYEFQVRTTVVTAHSHGLGAHASGMTRTPPPPIITSSPPHADGTVSISGQEYQQPGSTTHGAEPRSPAEIQNRGARQSTNEIRRVPAAAQGLRLITSITESDVPRALISPNPAVESPRVGGFTSPRSSILQAPGTPTVPSPTASMYCNMIPPSILSPASFQQRESSASSEAHTVRAPEAAVAGDALRIALGRESVNRESTHRNSLTFGAEPPRLKSFTDLRDSTPMDSQQALLNDLAARLRAEGFDAALEQCHEALSLMDGDAQAAYTILREQISTDMAYTREDAQSPTVQHLAELLGKDPAVCAEALRQTQNNTTSAMRLLLSPAGAEMERTLRRSLSTATRQRADRQDDRNSVASTSSDGIINVQEMMDENASYLLMESSSHQQPQRLRPGSPTKARLLDTNSASKSQLSLWIECIQGVDERVTTMSAIEIDQEETALCEVLTAVHARQLMRQIVRLFTDAEDQADNVLAAFSDPVTLRHLILFPQTSNSADDKNQKEVEEQVDSSVQRILSRMSEECFKAAGGSTVSTNLRLVENLSRLALSIDADKTWLGVSTSLPRLIHKLLDYEAHALTEDQSGLLRQTNMIHNLMVDTLLHTLSRTYVHHGSLMNWEAVMSKTRRPELVCPKGPIRLSSGIECIVVSTYDRMWSVPSPDPLLQYRHKWRKRSRTNGRSQESWLKANGDNYTTIWRPALPGGVKITSKTWFSLGDVLHVGGEIPETPVLLVSDDDGGLLLPPVGFERVDVSGKGLPKNSDNDPDFQRKQVRSLWWPIPPPGYAALGCFAGSKEDPFEPPSISSVRCIREDLVQRVESYTCMWRAEAKSFGPPTLLRALDHAADRKNQQADGHSLNLSLGSEELCVQISLWSVNSEFCGGILPVISVSGTNASGHSSSLVETATAFTINLSLEDKIVLAPITVNNVMSFVNTLIGCQQRVTRQDQSAERPVWTTVRPELSAALFALLKQVLKEKLPGGGHTAVRLVRAMITLIESGCPWRDKKGVLYCRSKIMTLQQDQEGGLMLNALLQAIVELMLAVDEQNRVARIEELTSCLDKDAKSSTMHLPYRFHFARDSHKEMLVSHSSKMAVTRHFSGEERRFLLEYHGDDTNPTALAATENSPPQNDHVSCRFEHTPELIMTLKNELKAEIVYFEVTIMGWGGTASTSSPGNGVLSFGYSPPEFPLEGLGVGLNPGDVKTYSFTPLTGKVQSPDLSADHWQWNEQVTTVAIGDIYGCGLRVDTHEVFFTKNGQLLGIAFSSVDAPWNLHPTISVNAECKLMINFGSSGAVGDRLYANKVNFAFRFNALDYDNVMSGFEWYEQLSQVYGVMKALLVHRQDKTETSEDSGVLPDEFMLSADNFLSEISEDVCIRVESGHPYDLELQEALVSIPLATSIRVKLDSQCETANSHCLQILQGGDNGESTSESEVRAFTGACGGQEVMIEGDSFVWRFPVQSNFQCRVDRVRKGPYLKLENRDTRLSLTRDKGWQTAIGVARFDSGIHIWEVRITFVTASSNIFLGIARRDVRLDSYLGKDNRGWGWIGNRALWHNGSKQRGTYGEKFKTGDVVRMTLDLKRGTLSYALNGKDLGVAFGPGGVGPKLEGTFYPGFALYNQRDSTDLIGGHRVEDGEVLPLGVNLALGGDEAYYSEDEDDAMGESDDSIPNFRMELATALTQMGFPMDWCVYALKHCEDDAEQAADFILANMHVMEALVREEAEAQSRRARHREAMAVAAAAAVEGPTIVSASESTPGDQELDQPTPAVSGEMAVDAAVPQNADKWGIAFTAVPEFSVTGRRLLAVKYGSKLRQLHASQAIFTPELDNAIVQIVNEICEARAEALLSCDPLRMAPEDFVPTEEHLRRFPQLQSVPLPQLQKRFLILRNFNCRLQNSLSFIDFSVEDERSLLARGSRALRGIIFQNVKLAWWLNILKEQQSPAAARPEIEVDRHRAREATEVSGMKDSVFAQCFDQLHSIQPSLLRGADRAFKCQFVGEFGDDFGGLYRECLAQISSELQSKVLPVLKPCPNAISLTGENREQYVPSAHLRSDARLVQMAEFLGKLIGIAIRTKTPLDLNLPAVFWKMLVHQRVTRQDIEAIHKGCFQVVDTIDNINKHGITESMFDEIIDATFTVLSSSRQEVELVPGGRAVPVQWEDRDAYARAVETYRLTEFAPVCEDIVRGIATILPAPTVSLFTWKEFATLVCGKPTVDVDLLRRRTIYGDGCQATDAHIAYFWEVLQEFTDEQKSSFLRFVWGRSRLPTHAADFTQDFKISGLPKATGRADQYLPIAHTCFFSIDLPSYSTRDVMRDKLLYAITHCQSIDADNTTVAQRAGQGLNWTAATNATTAVSSTSTVSATLAATTTAAATAAAAVSSVIAGLSASITES